MFILAWRTIAATAATVILAMAWLMMSGSGSLTLDQLLDKVTQADSLHLRIECAASKAELPEAKQASRAVEAWSARAKTGANQPIDESLFIVGDTLTEDGRIGKVTDVQGSVAVKPVMGERFTPVCGNLLLKPGDWMQTDPRGANAFSARLAGNSQIIAGPGTLVELNTPKKIRLLSGDLKIAVEKADSSPEGRNPHIQLLGPGEETLEIRQTGVYRIVKEKLVRLDQEPEWLKGFEGSEVQESIGSLVANVDGRNEPLTVGYHKVSVEIRDQIARTTVEESFANHTERRLEGVFYFPLPQDASISGFGMWIGGELVEADIVEKQRAREIYEEIRRENRDPGLLEWSGGNLFKARVFPIEPHSEKRIRIVYTQVLPLVGNSFRYSYALQSEMLKRHPLRELSIDVKLHSAVPLKDVSSPTHTVRADRTGHSAHVEFAAKEYTPNRDFEVVAELDGKQSEITVIPHRRGDDGYFMLMLASPFRDDETQDGRDLLIGKEPLDILFLADTSASMDEGQRSRQAEFIAAVLKSLTPRDTFNLACVDVECDFVFDKSQPADEKNIEAAQQFLGRRVSLGWTDLERDFSSAFDRANKNTRLIYIGDGIPTAGEGHPVAVSARLANLFHEKCRDKNVVCHSVSLGNTFESGVLKSIASLGGGSMRQITGEQGPRVVALDLLKEITRPALSNLKVQFRGLRVARVYPEQLPNLPAGSQQILLGRYLPEKGDQCGEILFTGRMGEREVQYKKTVSLKHAEEGNSFIPRLWARLHLDRLLQQGATPAIKDDIIALSEEYHIITPYTSLLVLESDADRERFKVKRGFQIRDGEKFFAEGRDNANFELIQQQMKLAGGWRLEQRKSVLEQLSSLGRETEVIPGERIYPVSDMVIIAGLPQMYGHGKGEPGRFKWSNPKGRDSSKMAETSGTPHDFDSRMDLITHDMQPQSWNEDASEVAYPTFSMVTQKDTVSIGRETHSLQMMVTPNIVIQEEEEPELGIAGDSEGYLGIENLGCSTVRGYQTLGRSYTKQRGDYSWDLSAEKASKTGWEPAFCVSRPEWEQRKSRRQRQSENILDQLFGDLPPQKAEETPAVTNDWPEEARTISKKLLRTAQLQLSDGGLKIETETDAFDPRFGNLTEKYATRFLVNVKSWLVRSTDDGDQTTIQWCYGRERGIIHSAFQLGRLRKAVAGDLKCPSWEGAGFELESLEETFAKQKVLVAHPAADRTLLIFVDPANEKSESRLLIDTKRNVVLSIEYRTNGKTTAMHHYGDFVEVAGAWWAGKVESRDEKGRLTSTIKQTVVRLDGEKFAQAFSGQLGNREKVQFLGDPIRKVIEAKKALKEGKADFDDRITLMMLFAQTQQWTRALEHLDAAEKLTAGRTGLRWLRYAMLKSSRRNEELKEHFLQEASVLVHSPYPQGEGPELSTVGVDHLFLANYLLEQSTSILESNEQLALLDALEPVFARQPEYQLAMKHWQQRRAESLSSCDRAEEALFISKTLAETYSHDLSAQQDYLYRLQNRREFAAERKWIDRLLSSDTPWEPEEVNQLRLTHASSLSLQERYDKLAAYMASWIEQNPESSNAYDRYLDALLYNDRIEQAYTLVDKWIEEGRRDQVSPAVEARLEAAVEWIRYDNHWNGYGLDKDQKYWCEQLAKTALFFARHETRASISSQILGDWDYRRTESYDKAREQLAKIFAENFDRMSVETINRFAEWLRGDDKIIDQKQWKGYARRLRERSKTQANEDRKYELLEASRNIFAFNDQTEENVAFLRQLVAEVPEKHCAENVSLLFRSLLDQPWSEKTESEAFDLLDKLQTGESPAERLLERIKSLHELTDHMLKSRLEAKNKAVEHSEKLTRTELVAKVIENYRKTREEFAHRLAREETKHEASLVAWIVAERLYLDVKLNRNLEQAAEICWQTLDAKEPQIDEDSDRSACIQAELDYALRNRYLVTIMNLAARKNASPELVRRLMDYLDQNIARESAEQTENPQWKALKSKLLIALNRPQELEKTLGEWIRAGDADNRWRTALGYIQAEQGKLKEAIATFESVAAADELDSDEYRALTDWYQAKGRRAEYEKSKLQTCKTMSEGEISQVLSAQLGPWMESKGQLPSELSLETISASQAALEKSTDPSEFINAILLPVYRAGRDFRLLACLADGMPGHTAEKIYPYLRSTRALIDEVREEATVDSLAERIVGLRDRAMTDVDRRALDLLEAMIERRAAELKNQPGPHIEKALAALQKASQREWSPGEEQLMADFLADLGIIPQEELAAEQLRQLEAFYMTSKPNTQQRLDMARVWTKALWNYKRRQASLDLLAAEINQYSVMLKERTGERPGKSEVDRGYLKPLGEQSVFHDYISFLGQSGQYDQAVAILQEQLKQKSDEEYQNELTARIFEVHRDALRSNGQVAGLQGEGLYRALQEMILAKLPSGDPAFDARLIDLLCEVYHEARELKIASAAADLKTFALGKLQQLLRLQVRQNEDLVNNLCKRVNELCSPAECIAILLECRDHQPRSLQISNSFWNTHGNRLTEWRANAKDLDPKLSNRLLRLVLLSLRHMLINLDSNKMPICDNRCPGMFWAQREADFLRTAEDVYAENRNSGKIILNVADYLAKELDRFDRAIEILQTADAEKLLDDDGQIQLVNYLHNQKRHGESIALLISLVARNPDIFEYRSKLVAAYFHTNRKADLFDLLQKTEDHFRKKDTWNETAMAAVAESCLQQDFAHGDLQRELCARALKYYEVLIPLHERTHPRRGIADGELSRYYANLAKCLESMNKTPEAVEAAFSAVVCWGPDFKNRTGALYRLQSVLRGCEDLDAYVVLHDKQCEKSGLQNPLLRKVLGQVYSERGQYDKAIVQLHLASELQPNDPEIHQALVTCCDRANDKQGAIRELLASVQLSRRDLGLYKELGRRFAELKEDRQSERAYTSIVEMLVSESESHAMLAEIRESQNRWSEAINEWRQVARLRALEPTGLLRLAAAQFHEKQRAAAAETVRQLRAKPWPQRFNTVESQISELEQQLRENKGAGG